MFASFMKHIQYNTHQNSSSRISRLTSTAFDTLYHKRIFIFTYRWAYIEKCAPNFDRTTTTTTTTKRYATSQTRQHNNNLKKIYNKTQRNEAKEQEENEEEHEEAHAVTRAAHVLLNLDAKKTASRRDLPSYRYCRRRVIRLLCVCVCVLIGE